MDFAHAIQELRKWEQQTQDCAESYSRIAALFADRLSKPRDTDEFYACENQGFLCLEVPDKEFTKIAYVISSPKSLRFLTSERVRGVGTAHRFYRCSTPPLRLNRLSSTGAEHNFHKEGQNHLPHSCHSEQSADWELNLY